jgi:choline-glycine betaine transporter
VSTPIGYGVSQFGSGVYNVSDMGWLMNVDGSPTKIAMIVRLSIVMVASPLSALSGVGKDIKWLPNINMGLSFFVLAFFLVFVSALFALSALFVGMWDYETSAQYHSWGFLENSLLFSFSKIMDFHKNWSYAEVSLYCKLADDDPHCLVR